MKYGPCLTSLILGHLTLQDGVFFHFQGFHLFVHSVLHLSRRDPAVPQQEHFEGFSSDLYVVPKKELWVILLSFEHWTLPAGHSVKSTDRQCHGSHLPYSSRWVLEKCQRQPTFSSGQKSTCSRSLGSPHPRSGQLNRPRIMGPL